MIMDWSRASGFGGGGDWGGDDDFAWALFGERELERVDGLD